MPQRLVFLVFLAGCASLFPYPYENLRASHQDAHTHFVGYGATVKHVNLDLTLDFQAHRAHGTAELTLGNWATHPTLVLDSQGLVIESVTGADGGSRAVRPGPRGCRRSARR